MMRLTSVMSGMIAVCATPLASEAQVFSGLGMSPNSSLSRATSLSSDGSTVVGWEFVGANVGWRRRIGFAPEYFAAQTRATGVSGDGGVVVGFETTSSTPPSFRWTSAGGTQSVPEVLRDLDPNPAVSGDGTFIVGRGAAGGGVRWSQATGAFRIPDPPRGGFQTAVAWSATGTSFDGAVVVGGAFVNPTAFPENEFSTPYRWTSASGTQLLTLPDGTHPPGSAIAASFDGNVVLTAGSGVGRWEAPSGIVMISGLAVNGTLAMPAMSGDGSTIVSLGKMWTLSDGLQDLTDVLTSAGCDFSGWTGLIGTGLSANGLALCGYGMNPQGRTEAWYATVPEPSAVVVLFPALFSRRRRHGV